MENFVLNGNGEIDINRKVMEKPYRFHLQEINHNTEICSNKDACDDTATSISSYSNYKQRIDAMFDDSRSILSDMSKSERRRKSLVNHNDIRSETSKERIIANNIQEKIEKMFEEISINGLQKRDSNLNRSFQKDQKPLPFAEASFKYDFRVTYLGSKTLIDKNVSLMSLQDPLKELYFEYKKKPPEDLLNVLTISKEGLKIKIGEKVELNPFSTIAVWASVKLSFRRTDGKNEYAFLPLITDPYGVDKNLLFKNLKDEDRCVMQESNEEKVIDDNQSPIFTVVMKNINMNKQLECHGFICKSSEDAIVIAANLYQALMKKLRRKKENKVKKVEKKDIVIEVPEPEEYIIKPKVKVKKPAPPIPEKEPQITSEPLSSLETNSHENVIKNAMKNEDIAKTEENTTAGKLSKRRGSVPVNIHNVGCEQQRTLRRTVSDRGGNSVLLKDHSDGGDILTKVAIPRSRSFLNANGPLTRYSGRHKTNTKNELVSPLGFKELFNEFRLHEGLESMDDILNAIIDAEGMSFNDLKPIYKEFLLKLAVTLTKDELYQRSKSIMRRQKKRNKKCNFRKKAFMSSLGWNKIFRKTASKLGKQKNSKPTNLEFTSIVFQSTTKQFESNLPGLSQNKPKSIRKKKSSNRRRLTKRLESVKNKNISTTSEDSDFFQSKRNTNDSGGGPNRSSSGYFSCSECSCDSENCTCLRTDKCYCTLGKKKSYHASSSDESRFCTNQKPSFRNVQPTDIDHNPGDSLKSCSCDTESCVESGKCYCSMNDNKRSYNKVFHLSEVKEICQTPYLHQTEKLHSSNCPVYIKRGCRKHGETIFDQLKEQGFAASESTLSRAASPTTAWHTNEKNLKQKSCTKATGSLKYLQIHRPEHHSEFLGQPQCYPRFEEHLLKEIQNTSRNEIYPSDIQHRGLTRQRPSGRKQEMQSLPTFPCGRRQYSSMRCRNEFVNDRKNTETLYRSMSCRTKHFFNSVRSKNSCDSIMNHIKFPNANCANSSLRFTRRMDVYDSFSENRRLRCQEYPNHLNFKENWRQDISEQEILSENYERYHINNGNFQRLDYNLFRTPKPIKPDTSKVNRKKVLVVSARDPKGKVLYMGTSSRCDNYIKNRMNFIDNAVTNASEAMSVKKSAEIAALFSDVTSKQKIIHSDYAKDQKQNLRAMTNSYRTTNLENTLGYLP